MQREHPWTPADISAALGVDLEQYPSGSWRINEYDNVLAIFTSADPALEKYSGSIIDYGKKVVIIEQPRIEPRSENPIDASFPEDARFMFPVSGSRLIVFIYKGKVYFATSRTLCQNKRQGVADYKALYAELKGPSMKALFRDDENNGWFYVFMLITQETSHVSYLPFNCEEKLVFTGSYRIKNYIGLAPAHYSKGMTDLTISREHANAIYLGDVAFGHSPQNSMRPCRHPDNFYVEYGGSTYKYESDSFKWRAKVRGDFSCLSPRIVVLFFMTQIHSDGKLRVMHETFEPLSTKFVRPVDNVLPVERDLPFIMYSGVKTAVDDVTGISFDNSFNTKIRLVSDNATAYKTDYSTNFTNLLEIVHMHLKAAISPLRHAELSLICDNMTKLITNITNYQLHRKDPLLPPYVPVALANGYIPNLPRTTMEKMNIQLDCEIGELPNTTISELVAKWACTCDCPDFFYLFKHFCSLDISPPSNMKRFYEEKYRIILDESRSDAGSSTSTPKMSPNRSPGSNNNSYRRNDSTSSNNYRPKPLDYSVLINKEKKATRVIPGSILKK